jgi:hypothetical protein
MSEENVEVMRRFIDQYGDAPSDLQGLAASFFEPDALRGLETYSRSPAASRASAFDW